MSAVKAKRAALKKQNISISVNVFIAKAVALALKEFPNINAECIGDAVVHKTKVNLGHRGQPRQRAGRSGHPQCRQKSIG